VGKLYFSPQLKNGSDMISTVLFVLVVFVCPSLSNDIKLCHWSVWFRKWLKKTIRGDSDIVDEFLISFVINNHNGRKFQTAVDLIFRHQVTALKLKLK